MVLPESLRWWFLWQTQNLSAWGRRLAFWRCTAGSLAERDSNSNQLLDNILHITCYQPQGNKWINMKLKRTTVTTKCSLKAIHCWKLCLKYTGRNYLDVSVCNVDEMQEMYGFSYTLHDVRGLWVKRKCWEKKIDTIEVKQRAAD